MSHAQGEPAAANSSGTAAVIPPKDPYDNAQAFTFGSRTDQTGRFGLSVLVVDPEELKRAKARSNLSLVSKLWTGLINFFLKFMVSLISLATLAAYFFGFFYFLWGRRMYDEFWQGMANQYQELPEARVYQVNLPPELMEFWEQFSFTCRKVCTVGGSHGGIYINSMFKIRKIEGHIDPQDYVFDSHMFEVEGFYKMKKRAVIDFKLLSQIKKYFDFELYDNLEYPDQIDGSRDPKVVAILSAESKKKGRKSLTNITNQAERDTIKNFLKLQMASSNPVYYPFIVNLPLKRTSQRIKYNNEEHDREWFYWEVEIVSRIGFGLSFVIGMLPAPVYTVDQDFEESGHNALIIDPQQTDKIPPELEGVLKDGQPDWVKSHLCDLKPGRKIADDAHYIESWRNIIPGEVPDSVGFDISNGKVKVGGGLAYAVDIDEFTKGFYNPTRTLWKSNQPVKSMAEQELEKNKKFQDEDEEGPQYIGDSFGIAYNCRSGYVFLTYNGTVINKPPDKVNTEINLAIMKKYDDEEEQFDYQKEMKKVNDNKYLKTLNLEPNTKKEIDIRKFIKINTGPNYVPCIYTDQNTKFRLNFGASAFRNRQPEFQAGILYKYTEEFQDLFYDNPKNNPDLIELDDGPKY